MRKIRLPFKNSGSSSNTQRTKEKAVYSLQMGKKSRLDYFLWHIIIFD
jgi:hypothetical protein